MQPSRWPCCGIRQRIEPFRFARALPGRHRQVSERSHRGRGQLLSSPEVGNDGRFRWQLPPGDYGVAVIHGGMSPAQQPHRLPGGSLVFVNGLVDPGIEFTLQPGRHQALGTLVVEVESRAPKDVLFGSERVFGRLREIRVEDDDSAPALGAQGAPVRAPMRRIERSVAR